MPPGVQVKITVSEDANRRTVRVDGWLSNGGVEELRAVLAATPGPFSLVLEDLRGTDPGGLMLLEGLARNGVALEGLSPYLQLLLAGSAPGGTLDAPTSLD